MIQACLSHVQSLLINRFKEAGGIVDFQIYCLEQGPINVADHHRAVIASMETIKQETDEYSDFQMTIDELGASRLEPERISWNDFLGTRFDSVRRGLIVHGKGSFPNAFFFYADSADKKNIIDSEAIDNGLGDGFAYAFSSPPYSVRLSPEELGKLFADFLSVVVCGDEHSEVYRWPTNWTNYFAAGDEWWGSFLWSVSNTYDNRVVVIAASSTD